MLEHIGDVILFETIELDAFTSKDWVEAIVPHVRRLWEEVREKPNLIPYEIHIQPIFDPDPEHYPKTVGMVVKIWIGIKEK